MSPIQASRLFQEMQTMAAGAAGANKPAQQTNKANGLPDFGSVMAEQLNKVNDQMQVASNMQQAFVKGENVDLVDVMVNVNKSKVMFTATSQIRNQLVSAYQDVFNMQV